MSACKISVIIPVYNGARFLNPCIDSVLRQTLKAIEIILVDDASTDSTPEIIDVYKQQDKRFLTVPLKNNEGLPAARNAGLKAASGEYIIFMDADDYWMDDEMLATLYQLAAVNKVDLIDFGFIRSASGEEKYSWPDAKTYLVDTAQDNNWVIRYNVWAKLIDCSFLCKNSIEFDVSIAMGEDALFSIELYCAASRLLVSEADYYCYRINDDGITGSAWNKKKLQGIISWLKKALSIITNSEAYTRKPAMLQSILKERITMLYNTLGPASLKVFDDAELHQYIDQWSECLLSLDPDYFESTGQDSSTDNYHQLSRIILAGDYSAYRAFFISASYLENIDKQQSVTLSRQQAILLGQDLLKVDKLHIRCDFGGGVVITLPKEKAHLVARQLLDNQNPSITLRFN